jgi:hypothetical protein
MSGLLERIVRARRASAESRLGPPLENGNSYTNGHVPASAASHVNGSPASTMIYHALQLADSQPVAVAAPATHEQPAASEAAIEAIEHAHAPEPDIDPDGTVEFDVTEPYDEIAAEPEPEIEEQPEPEIAAEPEPEIAAQPEPEIAAEPEPEIAAEPEPEIEEQATTEMSIDETPEVVLPPEPAPQLDSTEIPVPNLRERGRIRRRARYLRRLREVHLRDIGGFMVELNRFQRDRPDLVAAKIEGAAQIDRELRALQLALASEQPLRELREAGIGGACENCGAVHGSGDRFCAACGRPLQGPQE